MKEPITAESEETRSLNRTFSERFRGNRILKRGRGIETILGTDLKEDGQVVIKTVLSPALSEAAKARLAHEIAALNQLDAPGFPGSHHLGQQADSIYWVRPFIDGETLAERLRQRSLSVFEAVELGANLLACLKQAHASGVLHRDIKPSNVLLPADGTGGRLVDFGLARHMQLAAAEGDVPATTAVYLSPEQSGLLDSGLDARSDLYAFGVTLYEALTGRPPFLGERVGDILRQQLTSRPPPLTDLTPDAPDALARILDRLLRKDPRDRYQTAEGALADLEALATALRSHAPQPEIVVGAKDRRRTLTEPAFIGRAEEIAALEAALAQTRAGRGGLVLVEAESGGGKTWILEEFGKRAVSRGAAILRGRGLDQTAPQPFQMIAGVARELVSGIHAAPAWGQTIARTVGSAAPAICASLPELRPALSVPENASLGPETFGEQRSLAALSALLDALGSPERPVVLLLDDGQWADEPTLRLLERWQAQSHGDRRHVMAVLSFRSEEVPGDHPLRAIRPMHHLRPGPFEAEDVRHQVASMAGQIAEPAVQTIIEHARGNPFMAAAILHGLVETGALVSGSDGWSLVPHALAELQASDRVANIVAVRLTRLPDAPGRLLTVGAVLGRTFDPALAGKLARIEPRQAVQMVEEYRGRLVWADAAGTSFTFFHDKIREALLGRLSEQERRDLHRRAAERIQATEGQHAYELAYHFDAAGEPERALPHALSAAESARARFALELAERLYRIAARGDRSADRETQFRIAKELGEVLVLRERYDEAAEGFKQALALAGSRRARAEVEERWSQLELKRGRLADACGHAETALRLVGRWVPKRTFLCTLWSAWELLVQVLHTNFPKLFVGRRKLEDAGPDEFFAMRVYHSLNGPYFFSKGPAWASWAHLRHINLAERYPPTLERARAYAAHATIMGGFPAFFGRGLRMSRLGAELCERMDDVWGQAQALMFHSAMLHFSGRFAESVVTGKKAAELFDRTGDRWEANSGLDFAVTSLLRMGDLAETVRLAKHIHQRASEINDAHGLAWSLDAWARATEGKIPRELVAAERKRSREHILTSSIVEMTEAVCLIGEGQVREALAVLEETERRYRKEAGLFYDLNAPLIIYRATALRMLLEQSPPWNPGEIRRLRGKWKRAVRDALKIGRKYLNNLPHALREAAYFSASQGRAELARRQIDDSIAMAESRSMRYERAQSRHARARLGQALGWTDAASELAVAQEELDALRATVAPERAEKATEPLPTSLSLMDRFATVLQAGREIATALSPEALFPTLRHAALALLRAQSCLVLSCAEDNGSLELKWVHGDAGLSYSRELVRKAIAEGQAVTESSGGDSTAESLHRGGLRSVLCVPIFVRRQPFGCLYIAHRDLGDLFGEGERRIAEYLATLAGAALENAEGFAQVQSFSRELEQRVAERTAELARANDQLASNLNKLQETQNQLVEAGKMAAMGTLIAGLSHELNNPLAIILGYAQGLLRSTTLEPSMESSTLGPLQAIERQTLRCRQLVQALLNFSHMKPSSRERVAPGTLLSEVIELVTSKVRNADVSIRTEPAAQSLPEITLSPQGIQSVLLNLLSNAIEASPKGGEIVLEARALSRQGRAGVQFLVRDAGPGIPADVRPRIFDPFFTTKPVGQGIGLGLSLAQQIVREHAGAIEIESVQGAGTTAFVWLPTACVEVESSLGLAAGPGAPADMNRQNPSGQT
jgi:signal transduction histidine kinase/tetratricopeptide (TPR) repeat protein